MQPMEVVVSMPCSKNVDGRPKPTRLSLRLVLEPLSLREPCSFKLSLARILGRGAPGLSERPEVSSSKVTNWLWASLSTKYRRAYMTSMMTMIIQRGTKLTSRRTMSLVNQHPTPDPRPSAHHAHTKEQIRVAYRHQCFHSQPSPDL